MLPNIGLTGMVQRTNATSVGSPTCRSKEGVRRIKAARGRRCVADVERKIGLSTKSSLTNPKRWFVALAVAVAAVVVMSPVSAGALGLPPGIQVVSPPASIVTDCSVDVTKPLYDWLNSLPEGTSSAPTEILFASNGCYQIDGMLYLRGFNDFVFNGNGSTFKQSTVVNGELLKDPPRTGSSYCGSSQFPNGSGSTPLKMDIMWFIEGGCDLVFENMNVQGINANGNGGTQKVQDAGIQLSGVQRAVVTNDTIDSVWGDFITVTGLHEAPFGGITLPSLDITIENNSMKASGRQGVTVVYGQRVSVTGNTLRGNIPDSAIDLEADSSGGTEADILIDNNTMDGYTWLLSAKTEARFYDIAFTNNTVRSFEVRMNPLTSTNGHDVTFSDNTSEHAVAWSLAYNLSLNNLATVLVSGNTALMQPPAQTFVHVGRRHVSTDIAVQDNTLSPSPAASANFLPIPLHAAPNIKATECNNQTSSGTALDDQHPNRLRCVTSTPVQPAAPALPVYASP